MGARTGNPTWVDSATVQEAEANPSRKITAAKLNAIEGAIDNSAEAVHDHDATDITTGTLSPARLGTGTRDGSRFLRDDGAWAEPPSGGGGGASTLGDLTDVDTTGATAGDVLKYDGSEWVADAASAGTVTSTDISDSTATGRAVLTAADAATARSAIGAAPATQAINAKTGAYTLIASDAGKLVTLTLAAPADLTVPSGVFTAGQRVDIADRGTARVTVVAGSGMTVNPPPGGSLVMEGRYAYASLVFISATEADLVGLVAAP